MADALAFLYETSRPARPLSDACVRRLCVRARRGNTSARDRMVCAHVGLVMHIAKYFYRPGAFLDFSDLVQQGCLGLLHAIDKFDPNRRSRGRCVQFKTFAHYWVSHSIRREIQNHGRTVAVPIDQLSHVMQQMICLDAIREWKNEQGDTDVFQIADAQDTPDHWCRNWEARVLMARLLMRLSSTTRRVVCERHGLGSRLQPASQEQIGKRLGVSSARVGQWERNGLQLLRQYAATFPAEAVSA